MKSLLFILLACLPIKSWAQDIQFLDNQAETTCQYLTTSLKDELILSFGKQNDAGETMMYFAKFDTKVQTFGQIQEILPTKGVSLHNENAPKLIIKPSGEWLAVWGVANPSPQKKYGGLVRYAQSFDAGKTWSKPQPLTKDTTSIDQRYFDITLLPTGEVAIVWLDSRTKNKKEGTSALFFAQTVGKTGFQGERFLNENVCPCCKTDLLVDSKGNIHISHRQIIKDKMRDIVHLVSQDAGKTFSLPVRISADNWAINACPHTGPTMVETKKGVQFAWFTMGGGQGLYCCESMDSGKSFTPRDTLTKAGKHPYLTRLKNGNVVALWDEGKQIALQQKDKKGKIIQTQYIPTGEWAQYPIALPIDKNRLLIVWTQAGEKKKIAYQVYQ